MDELINTENIWDYNVIKRTTYIGSQKYLSKPSGDAKDIYGRLGRIDGNVTGLKGCCSGISGNAEAIKLFSNDLTYLYNLFSYIDNKYFISIRYSFWSTNEVYIAVCNNEITHLEWHFSASSNQILLNDLLNKLHIHKEKYNKIKLLSKFTKNIINDYIKAERAQHLFFIDEI